MSPDSAQIITFPNTREGHRDFNAACETRANMVHLHKTRKPGQRLSFETTQTGYKVAPDGSFRKISELTHADKRAERKARWKAARSNQQKESQDNK